MVTKGTGWVPDFPDVKDYTLKSKNIQALGRQVQTDRFTESVETLTTQVSEALELLKKQSSAADGRNEETSSKLDSLLKKLEKQSGGGVCFIPSKIHRLIKPGTFDPDISKVKQYLDSIYPGVIYPKESEAERKKEYLTNPLFDELTSSLVQHFKSDRDLTDDGVIDYETMSYLRLSSDLKEKIRRDNMSLEALYTGILPKSQEESKNAIFVCLETIKILKSNIESSTIKEEIEAALKELSLYLEEHKLMTRLIKQWLTISKDGNALSAVSEKDIDDLIQRIQSIPMFLPLLYFSYKIYEIPDFIPGKMFEVILDKLLQRNGLPNIEELIKVVPTSVLEQEKASPDNQTGEPSSSGKPTTEPEISTTEAIAVSTPVSEGMASVINIDVKVAPNSTEFLGENSGRSLPISWPVASDSPSSGQDPMSDRGIGSQSTASPMKSDSPSSDKDPMSERYTSQKLKQDRSRLEKQLHFIGVELSNEHDSQVSSEDYNKALDTAIAQHKVWQTQRLSRAEIPDNVNVAQLNKQLRDPDRENQIDALKEEWLQHKQQEEKLEELTQIVRGKFYQLIQPMVKVIFQIIMPLGQYKNLDKALDRGLDIFEELVAKANRNDNENIKKFKRWIAEAIQESGVEIDDNDQELEIEGDLAYWQSIATDAIRKMDAMLPKSEQPQKNGSDQPNGNNSDQSKENGADLDLHQVIKKIIENYGLPTKQNDDLASGRFSIHKTVLEVIDPENYVKDPQADLQLPVSWDLKTYIKDALALSFQESGQGSIHVSLPERVDLSLWCSPIEDQGPLNSCTAHAGVGLTEYFAKKAFGKHTDVSPLFLYKVARNLMHRVGDTGASVRETMKAMVLFGIPPESHWPQDEKNFDAEPNSFCYSFAQNYQALKYFRLDYAGIEPNTLLVQIKAILVAGFPCMFGFTPYTSINEEDNVIKGHIPYPSELDTLEGGHAVMAVGYDDRHVIKNADGKRSQGAILIRNSWGTHWGSGGYGWLPYDYVLGGLTADWWSLFQAEWFESGQFGVGSSNWSSDVGAGRKGRY